MNGVKLFYTRNQLTTVSAILAFHHVLYAKFQHEGVYDLATQSTSRRLRSET